MLKFLCGPICAFLACAALANAMQPEPTGALTGTVWRLADLAGDQSAPEAAKDAPQLLLTADGAALGFGGCNYFVGKYKSNAPEKLLLSTLRAQHKSCEKNNEREAAFLATLILVDSFRVAEAASDAPASLTLGANELTLARFVEATDVSAQRLEAAARQAVGGKVRHKSARHKPAKSAKSGKHASTAKKKSAVKREK